MRRREELPLTEGQRSNYGVIQLLRMSLASDWLTVIAPIDEVARTILGQRGEEPAELNRAALVVKTAALIMANPERPGRGRIYQIVARNINKSIS